MTRVLAALVVLLSGCESTCEPGRADLRGRVAYSRVIRPVNVRVFLRHCSEDELPHPKVHATNADGATIEGFAGPAEPSPSGGSVDYEISFYDLLTGWLTLTMVYPGGQRDLRIYVADNVDTGSAVARVDGRCRAPVRLEDGYTLCNSFNPAEGTANVVEQDDAGVVALPQDSQLFETSGRYLITSPDGIGWLEPGQRLAQWTAARPFGGRAWSVAVDEVWLYVFADDVVRIFPKDLSTELPSLTTAVALLGGRRLAAHGDLLVVGSERGGSIELFRRVGASWTSLGVQPEPRRFVAASDDGVWTCSDTEVQWNELTATGLEPRYSLELFGECRLGSTQRPRIITGENPFMACPYRTADGIKFVEAYAQSRSGECFDQFAVLDFPSNTGTFVFDLSAGLP